MTLCTRSKFGYWLQCHHFVGVSYRMKKVLRLSINVNAVSPKLSTTLSRHWLPKWCNKNYCDDDVIWIGSIDVFWTTNTNNLSQHIQYYFFLLTVFTSSCGGFLCSGCNSYIVSKVFVYLFYVVSLLMSLFTFFSSFTYHSLFVLESSPYLLYK